MKKTLWIATAILLTGCGNARQHVYSGTLELTEHSVGARVAGRLTTLLVDEGDAVKKGQLIGTLERADQTEKDYRRAQALFETLTPRERDVLALVAAGLMNKQIAAEIGIAEITVKIHRGHIMRKMRTKSLADLVRITERLGFHGIQPKHE